MAIIWRIKLVLFSLLCLQGKAQEFNVGLAGAYNSAVSDPGLELRLEQPLNQILSFTPQISYYPGFNNIQELFAGLNLQYAPFQKWNTLKPYTFAGIHYNHWINQNPLLISKLRKNNILPVAGVGVQKPIGKLMIFAELNYITLSNELQSKIGLYVQPFKRNKLTACPKIK